MKNKTQLKTLQFALGWKRSQCKFYLKNMQQGIKICKRFLDAANPNWRRENKSLAYYMYDEKVPSLKILKTAYKKRKASSKKV